MKETTTVIYCPNCATSRKVHGMDWVSSRCQGCNGHFARALWKLSQPAMRPRPPDPRNLLEALECALVEFADSFRHHAAPDIHGDPRGPDVDDVAFCRFDDDLSEFTHALTRLICEGKTDPELPNGRFYDDELK
jgi:hypothetical protein